MSNPLLLASLRVTVRSFKRQPVAGPVLGSARLGSARLGPARLGSARLGLGVGWCIHVCYLHETLIRKFHVIIAANASSVCYTSRLNFCVQTADANVSSVCYTSRLKFCVQTADRCKRDIGLLYCQTKVLCSDSRMMQTRHRSAILPDKSSMFRQQNDAQMTQMTVSPAPPNSEPN